MPLVPLVPRRAARAGRAARAAPCRPICSRRVRSLQKVVQLDGPQEELDGPQEETLLTCRQKKVG